MFSKVIERRAYKVADIFNEKYIKFFAVQLMFQRVKSFMDKDRIEVARASCCELDSRNAFLPDPDGIEVSLNIPFQNRNAHLIFQRIGCFLNGCCWGATLSPTRNGIWRSPMFIQ